MAETHRIILWIGRERSRDTFLPFWWIAENGGESALPFRLTNISTGMVDMRFIGERPSIDRSLQPVSRRTWCPVDAKPYSRVQTAMMNIIIRWLLWIVLHRHHSCCWLQYYNITIYLYKVSGNADGNCGKVFISMEEIELLFFFFYYLKLVTLLRKQNVLIAL